MGLRFFVAIKALVSGFDELGGRAAVVGIDANADTDAERRLPGIAVEAAFNALGHVFRHTAIGVDEYDGEFVAAIACGQVGRAAMLVHDRRKPAQRAVAGQVALQVVDALKTVEIQKQKSEGPMAAFGAMNFPLEAVHKLPVVR